MRIRYHLLVIAVLLGLVACTKTIKAPIMFDKTEKGKGMYEQAEKLFNLKAYEDALKVFDEYLVKYPDQPLADETLMKMGKIYSTLDRGEGKINVYKRL